MGFILGGTTRQYLRTQVHSSLRLRQQLALERSGCGAGQPLLKFLICRVVAKPLRARDATLACNPVTICLRLGPREESIRSNRFNATAIGRQAASR
jgi:hypothetical protein